MNKFRIVYLGYNCRALEVYHLPTVWLEVHRFPIGRCSCLIRYICWIFSKIKKSRGNVVRDV